MPAEQPDTLPLPQYLAVNYAIKNQREIWRAYFALDAHLAELVRKTTEPLLGQVRLAWWRDRLQETPDAWPKGNPLLELIASGWGEQASGLGLLVDGWEHLLADPPIEQFDINGFANGRASAIQALAALSDAAGASKAAFEAGRRWALADLASHTANYEERERILATAQSMAIKSKSLPRELRPLAILDGLARRSIANGGAPLFSGRRAALVCMRLGMFGH